MCFGQQRHNKDELDMIDWDPVPCVRDLCTCAGPSACNIAVCTMWSSYNYIDVELDYQVPWLCQVSGSRGENITFPPTLLVSTDPFFHQIMQESKTSIPITQGVIEVSLSLKAAGRDPERSGMSEGKLHIWRQQTGSATLACDWRHVTTFAGRQSLQLCNV